MSATYSSLSSPDTCFNFCSQATGRIWAWNAGFRANYAVRSANNTARWLVMQVKRYKAKFFLRGTYKDRDNPAVGYLVNSSAKHFTWKIRSSVEPPLGACLKMHNYQERKRKTQSPSGFQLRSSGEETTPLPLAPPRPDEKGTLVEEPVKGDPITKFFFTQWIDSRSIKLFGGLEELFNSTPLLGLFLTLFTFHKQRNISCILAKRSKVVSSSPSVGKWIFLTRYHVEVYLCCHITEWVAYCNTWVVFK